MSGPSPQTRSGSFAELQYFFSYLMHVYRAHGRVLGAHGRVLSTHGYVLRAHGCVLDANQRALATQEKFWHALRVYIHRFFTSLMHVYITLHNISIPVISIW